MSFTCAVHGWRHAIHSCPGCMERITSGEVEKLRAEVAEYREALEKTRLETPASLLVHGWKHGRHCDCDTCEVLAKYSAVTELDSAENKE